MPGEQLQEAVERVVLALSFIRDEMPEQRHGGAAVEQPAHGGGRDHVRGLLGCPVGRVVRRGADVAHRRLFTGVEERLREELHDRRPCAAF